MANMELLTEGRFGYYSILGICKQASEAEIRVAYRKLALKWHPDRWMKDPKNIAGDAKRKFQEIQEAYSVLSNKRKRSIYDAGLLDLLGDDGDDEGFCEFMQEMASIMKSQKSQEKNSLEDLQRLFAEMVNEEEMASLDCSLEEPINESSKRKRVTSP